MTQSRNTRLARRNTVNAGAGGSGQTGLAARLGRFFQGRGAARVAELAGSTPGAVFEGLEQLEQRQLLALISIGSGDVNPQTGLGTVIRDQDVWFQSFRAIVGQNTQQTAVNEDFNDEMAGWTNAVPPAPPNGTFFAQSNIQIAYSSIAATPVQLVRRPIGQNQTDAALRIRLQQTDQVTFVVNAQNQGGGNPQPRQVTTLAFQVSASPGTGGSLINTDPVTGTRLELLRNGQVVATFRGTALENLAQASAPPPGVATTARTFTIRFDDGFDSFRLRSSADAPNNSTYSEDFILETINTSLPGGQFSQQIERLRRTLRIVFTGPVGASLDLFDLYGRAFVPGTFPISQGNDPSPTDPTDVGRPQFNDGIGRVVIAGTNVRSSLTITGSLRDQQSQTFALSSLSGLEQSGIGYAFTRTPDPQVIGLPPGQGSILIGSPYVRDNSSPQAYRTPNGFQLTADDFNRPDQGVFINDGSSIGSILIDGILHGSSSISGAVDRFSVGVMMGSLRVDGDLGVFSSASDAGVWFRDDDTGVNPNSNPTIASGSRLTVGRTVREVSIAGRNSMSISVLGDVNSSARARLPLVDFFSREAVVNIAQDATESATVARNAAAGESYNGRGNNLQGQAVPYGGGYFRNDDVSGAEFVGYNGTRVRVFGTINGSDPVNSAPDGTDVYAFPADPSREVVISAISSSDTFGGFTNALGTGAAYYRVVDRDGRVVAAIDVGRAGRGPSGNATRGSIIRFRPDRADVYYLVLSVSPQAGGVGLAYGVSITGMAPVTLGAVKSDSGTGGQNAPFNIALSAGSMGLMSVGMGFRTSGGGLALGSTINTNQAANKLGEWTATTTSVPGTLYGATTGFDINGANLVVGENLGTLATGQINRSVLNGDIYNMSLRVGGTIGTLDILGALGADQVPDPNRDPRFGTVSISSGRSASRRGDIGQILVGAYVSGGNVRIETNTNSQIDQFLVGTNNDGAGSEFPGQILDGAPVITTGTGADVRFVDFRQLSRQGDADARQVITYGQSITLTDDAGATVTLTFSGGAQLPAGSPPGTLPPTNGTQAVIRTLPINGSRGVAIASIDLTLRGGADFTITGNTAGVVSIGRITVDADTGGNGQPGPVQNPILSNLRFTGTSEIDVLEIRQVAGLLNSISNTTQGGDLIAVDANQLNTLSITAGDLGRSQVSTAGPALLGPFRDIGGGAGGATGVGGPLAVRPGGINQQNPGGLGGSDWNGQESYLPVNIDAQGFWDGTPQSLEDVGSPIDGYLNGLVVRNGDVQSVTVSGSVGDVLVEGGQLIAVTANSDGVTPQGQFHGIVGSIYAAVIGTVDVGDGLLGTGPSPLAAAGIFADQAIVSVLGTRGTGALIQGTIMAAGVGGQLTTLNTTGTPTTLPQPVLGIGEVRISGGRFDGALILAQALDDFWQSVRVQDIDVLAGNVREVSGTNADLFRSEIGGLTIGNVTITNGAYDATFVNAGENIGTIRATTFRNSTRLGDPQEFVTNRIQATRDLANVTADAGRDISDLTIDISGSLTGSVSARNFERVNFQVDNTINAINAAGDFRGNTVVSGGLTGLTVAGDVRSSAFRIAGPIGSITSAGEITQVEVQSTGPDGRIGLLRAQGLLQGNVSSSGDIGTIESVASNVVGRIETRNDILRPRNGGIATLRAGNDLLVDLSILGNAGTVVATRNIGSFGANNFPLDIRGNLGSLTTVNGQNYADLLVGQSVTGVISNGRVDMRPGTDRVSSAGILVFGRINAIVSSGDWAGDIISRSGGIGSITINQGSFRPGHSIIVNNGSLDSLTINAGDLLGNVLVDRNIGAITLNSQGNWRAQIGVSDFKRDFNRVGTDIRNQLPAGVQRTSGVDGVLIKAGGDIASVTVNGGSIWESTIFSGGTIGSVRANAFRNDTLTPGLNNAIVATTRIDSVVLNDFVGGLAILAGVESLGADDRVGGTDENLDTVGAGSIGTVRFNGSRVTNSVVFAGIAPSFDGEYNTTSSRVTSGRSIIDSVTATGVINNTQVFSDGALGATSPGMVRGDFRAVAATEPPLLAGGNINPQAGEVRITQDTAFQITTQSGERARVTISGPGRAFWSQSLNRVRLINTTNQTSITIVPAGTSTTLTNFRLLGARNVALGTLNIQPRLNGDSSVFVDNLIASATFGVVDTTGTIGAGGNMNTVSIGRLLSGTLRGRFVGSLSVAGELGASAAARVQFLTLGSLNVAGNIAGAVSVDRDLPTVTAGSINGGGIRSGGSIGSVTVGSMLNGRIAARNAVISVSVAGDATGSSILGGVDLGRDADFGGSGTDADVVGAGSVGTVTVGGNFRRSDVGAGVSRGPSGFLGNSDIAVSAGRSSIGSVTIAGSQVGSSLNSEQYRVIATGTVGAVTVGGVPFTGSGNFQVERRDATAVPVRVTNLTVSEDARIYTARISFNQQIDIATVSQALSVVELRNGGAQTIGLAEGTDYTISYDAATATVLVTFARALTERNLPQQPGVPGPGVYQLVLSASVLRGSTRDSRLDGNADGAGGDDWSRNIIVGDAGDKITAGNPTSAPQIDFYGAADLNLVLRNTPGVGSVPEVNTPFTVTGVIGDHPDTDPDIFRLGGDVDVYRISLRAGQILRLGELSGVALGASVTLHDAAGAQIQAGSGLASTLPANAATQTGATGEQQFLIRSTATYYIVVAGSAGANIADVNAINNADVTANAFGRYAMEVTVLDDGDTGFNGDTASGTGAPIAYAPTPDVFAGPDGVFNTADDLSRFTVGDWTFRLVRGSTSPAGPDAVVTGTNSKGYISERRSAPNGTFGSANDRIRVSIDSSIGLPNSTGNPEQVSPDVDVFRLNNGNPIAPGTKLRVTLRLTEQGSNIGLAPEATEAAVRSVFNVSANLLSQAILGVFEMPAGTGFDNAKLVFAPSDFLPIGNQPARTTTDGRNSYGYDSEGNFFFDIVLPAAQGTSNAPAAYAIALQGAIRSDYNIEIVSQGTGSLTTRPQNILLETLGGTIDWLEAGQGVTTRLSPFATSVVGFSGQIDGQSVDNYVLNSLITNLNSIFTAANIAVNIATTPAGFQRDDFSTVFLAGNVEPNAFFGNQQFGASQHVDGLNADRNDQAVVFLSSLAELGFDASRQGVDLYVQALTAAVGRRIGELLGVRMEGPATGGGTIPIMASNSPTLAGQGTYAFTSTTRNLAGTNDNILNTAFYFGSQNSGQLVNKIIQSRF